MDELTEGIENSGELVDKARVYLIQREMALVKTRGQNNDDSKLFISNCAQKQFFFLGASWEKHQYDDSHPRWKI